VLRSRAVPLGLPCPSRRPPFSWVSALQVWESRAAGGPARSPARRPSLFANLTSEIRPRRLAEEGDGLSIPAGCPTQGTRRVLVFQAPHGNRTAFGFLLPRGEAPLTRAAGPPRCWKRFPYRVQRPDIPPLLLSFLTLNACGAPQGPRPNVLLIFVHALRAGHLGHADHAGDVPARSRGRARRTGPGDERRCRCAHAR